MVEENTHLSAAMPQIPCIPSVSQRKLSRAWESFVDTGHFGADSPRSIIARGWERSRHLGVDPRADRARTVLSADEIEAWLAREDLGRAGRPVLDDLVNTLYGTRHVIVLADARGRILYSVGHRQIQDDLETINFCPGGGWSETEVGPNGVGTPLALGRPEVVLGIEHYCRGWQPWVCYGAPIINPLSKKQPLGTIDITGPVCNISQEAMVLAVSVTQTVQAELAVRLYEQRDRLRALAKDKRSRWPDDGIIVVDLQGDIVDANARVSRYLGVEYSAMFNRPVSEYLPDVWSAIEHSLRNGVEGELTIDVQTGSGVIYPGRCRVEPIASGSECIGTLLILSGTAGPRQQVAPGQPAKSHFSFDNILGDSPAIQKTRRLAYVAARDPLENSVLLIGETGTGKELLAHAIHAESARAGGPFIAVNCGALPRELIESEMFGYVAGAFTGARHQGQAGKFETAHNGTLFLDEIDSLAPDLQAKFLRVLDNKEITRLGSTLPVKVDVRIIAAASPDLNQALYNGNFRRDLYHRLCVIEVVVPALRERGEDIITLAEAFLASESLAAGGRPPSLSTAAKDYLRQHDWPGNIRELRNICVRWLLTAASDVISHVDLPQGLYARPGQQAPRQGQLPMREVADDLIRRTLEQTEGNISEAARRLGINRSTIYRRRQSWPADQ